MRSIQNISITALITNIFFLIFFPLAYQLIDLVDIIKLIIVILMLWGLGYSLIARFNLFEKLSFTLQYGISIFLGATISFSLLLLQSLYIPLLLSFSLLVVFFIYIIWDYRWKIYRISTSDIFLLLIIFFTLFVGENFYESISQSPILRSTDFIDNYYYTSLVASLRSGNIYTSIFETGTPLNYHIGGFVGSASIAGFSGLSSHIVTWAVWVPFLKFISLLLLAETSKLFILKNTSILNIKWLSVLTLLLYLFLATLNPKFFIHFDISKALWIGTPYTLPDMPALSSGFLCSFLILYIVLIEGIESKRNTILFILLFSFLVICKVTFFFSLGVFLGLLALHDILNKKYRFFITLILSLLPTFLLYKLTFTSTSVNKIIPSFGYLADWLNTFGNSNHSLLGGSLIMLGVILLGWINIKLLGLIYLYKNIDLRKYSLCSFLSLLTMILLASSVRIVNYDDFGIKYLDMSYDLLQFIKAALVFVSFFGGIGLIYLLYSIKIKIVKFFLQLTILIWIFTVLASIIILQFNTIIKNKYYENVWAKEAVTEIKTLPISIMAMVSNNRNSGQLISAYDIGVFWSCFSYLDGGVTHSNQNFYRQRIIKNIITNPENDISNDIFHIKKEGVKYLIAIPELITKFEILEQRGYLKKHQKWVYIIN